MSDVGGNPEHKWGYKKQENIPSLTESESPLGRFAANLLVQNDVLNDGVTTTSKGGLVKAGAGFNKVKGFGVNTTKGGEPTQPITMTPTDEGSFSRYFDMDAWWEDRKQKLPANIQATYPFMIVPKASKSEKNKGCEELNPKQKIFNGQSSEPSEDMKGVEKKFTTLPSNNFHPTVKPISLMSYLVTMGSRENDLVLDPFVGSGTTCIAAKLLNRKYLGMELNDEYAVIAQERIKAHKLEKQEHNFF